MLIVDSPTPADIHGTVGWAAGYSSEENPFDELNHSEEWSVFQKAFLFGVILTAVAVWVRVSSKRQAAAREVAVSYEKTMA